MPQGRGLFAGMTVRENLSLGRLARKTDGSNGVVWDEEKILEYFPRLRERMDVAADYLSGGEQQMVAVARAMSGNVKLLLLDEPFEGLAPTVILDLFKVFDKLRQHISIVIVEHNLDLVLALADRVFALERGAVFHEGPAQPLLTDLDYRKKIFVAMTLTASLRGRSAKQSIYPFCRTMDCFAAPAMTALLGGCDAKSDDNACRIDAPVRRPRPGRGQGDDHRRIHQEPHQPGL